MYLYIKSSLHVLWKQGVRRFKACLPFVSCYLKSFLSMNSACRLYNLNKMVGFYIVK